MENAKNTSKLKYQRVLTIGDIGTGKTQQFLTLPGKKYLYVFDPNAIATIAGWDVDYDEFLPGADETDFYPTSIKKGGKVFRDTKRVFEPTTYLRWTEDVNEKVDKGFFDAYDVVGLDGLTMFSAAAMDRILWLQNKVDRDDERTDYRIAGDKISNALRALTQLKAIFYCTAHIDMVQDEKTKRVFKRIMLPGGARTRVPTLFTNVLILKGELDDSTGEYKYIAQTRPDRENPIARTSMLLDTEVDVTIPQEVLAAKDSTKITKYGIGGLLEKSK